ncbi:MAG: redox-sensing transcriptional repressor Rex [Sphaerochaetaceae bacterium]|nr:redox-sensing transcriptional repressor Rex [Spirochaetales bacterium]MDY5499395.1 redox-sensing transcriptional repressor Rex [Sphaerochaetaceae bacterium]
MNNEQLVRITRYYRALNRLRTIGLEKVFAHNLADAAGVSPAIVRKDFSQLAIHGQKRGGYEIIDLIGILGSLLGKGDPQNCIIVGCGRIGKALIHYTGFEPDGIRIVAGFDNDPNVYTDSSSPIPLYSLNRLDEIVSALKVKVAIITVPEAAAQESYDRLLKAGVRGILNFSPVTLKPIPQEDGSIVVVHNINIALELEQIFYELKFPAMSHRE